MAIFYKGYENISVELRSFVGNDLAKQVVMFGNLAEFYTGLKEYSEDNPIAQQIVDDIIAGRTFPRYAFDGHNIVFQINNISRINLAQLTRERGIFCSESSGTRPLTNTFITPLAIYNDKELMTKLTKIQREIESLYEDMAEKNLTYLDSRYFGFHAQTISINYMTSAMNFMRSCNSRTENNFADEINYVYRLMLFELKKAIKEQVTDKLSLKLWNWLLSFADKKSAYTRDNSYNNDFKRFPDPEGWTPSEPARNDWRKSSWKLELEKMYYERPELLFDGEKEMIEKWLKLEKEGKELPSTYSETEGLHDKIKEMYYYLDDSQDAIVYALGDKNE